MVPCRQYPPRLGKALIDGYMQACAHPFRRDLRKKYDLDAGKSDRELFHDYPLTDDQWWESGIQNVFFYLYGCKSLQIPDSWLPTMNMFKWQLTRLIVPRMQLSIDNFLYLGLVVFPCPQLCHQTSIHFHPNWLGSCTWGRTCPEERPELSGLNAQNLDHETPAKTHKTTANFHKRAQKKKSSKCIFLKPWHLGSLPQKRWLRVSTTFHTSAYSQIMCPLAASALCAWKGHVLWEIPGKLGINEMNHNSTLIIHESSVNF